MTNEKLEITLDERSRIEAVIRKFLPSIEYQDHKIIDFNSDEDRYEHHMKGMNVRALEADQRAVAFNFLGNNYLRNANLKANFGQEVIARWNGFNPPAPVPCSDGENMYLSNLTAAAIAPDAIGHGRFVMGECEDTPIYAFKGALEDFIMALGCFEATSPELRRNSLHAHAFSDIIRASQIINIPDDTLKRWGYLFGDSVRGSDLSGFHKIKKLVYDKTRALTNSTPILTQDPKLRDKYFFEKVDAYQKKYLRVADRITTLENNEHLDTQRKAMAYLYHKAGEKNLADFIAGRYYKKIFDEIHDVLFDDSGIVVLQKSPKVIFTGSQK